MQTKDGSTSLASQPTQHASTPKQSKDETAVGTDLGNAPITTKQPIAAAKPLKPPSAADKPLNTNVPSSSKPGLEEFKPLKSLFIKQDFHKVEVCCNCEVQNSYQVFTEGDVPVAVIKEEDSGCCTRNCLLCLRPFTMSITSTKTNQKMVKIERPCRSNIALCYCCLQVLSVFDANDQLIGCVRQNYSLCLPSFSVYDELDQLILKITGPCCTTSICCNDITFRVMTVEGKRIGEVIKQWSGAKKEIFTDADNFLVNFPVDLDVKTKATLFAATFLIDFLFFED